MKTPKIRRRYALPLFSVLTFMVVFLTGCTSDAPANKTPKKDTSGLGLPSKKDFNKGE